MRRYEQRPVQVKVMPWMPGLGLWLAITTTRKLGTRCRLFHGRVS